MFTLPKCLRVYLKNDRTLHADVSRLICRLLSGYFNEAVGRKIMTGMVSSHQTFGEYASRHPSVPLREGPHWHTIVLEGGFDRRDRFVSVPVGASEELVQFRRVKVVELLAARGFLNAAFAKKLLGWKHSDSRLRAIRE
jgi:hypothetical protein